MVQSLPYGADPAADAALFEFEQASEASAHWPELPSNAVKSAARALQILEYFDHIRRTANVIQVSRALSYPQSSTSILLRSLVTLGYLDYNRRSRTYRPTNRVRLLGSWIEPELFQDGMLLDLLSELNEETSDLVALASRNALSAQYIHVVQAKTALRLHVTPGTSRPISTSVMGWVMLSSLPDLEVAKILRRINAEAGPQGPIVRVPDLLRRLEEIRRDGYAFSHSQITPGAAVLAMPLPTKADQSPLVIGIGSTVERMEPRLDGLVELLRSKISAKFGSDGPACRTDAQRVSET